MTANGHTPTIMWVDEELVPFELHDGPGEGDDDTLNHYVCCDDDTALCGSDLSGMPWTKFPVDQDTCLVCLKLTRCPDCGDQLEDVVA